MSPSKKELPVVQVAQPASQPTPSGLPAEFQHLLQWIGTGLERMEEIEQEQTREEVFALLEGIDVLHRQSLGRLLELVAVLGGQGLVERISQDPMVHTLLEMYDLPEADERTQVERALENVYPYFRSHGGKLELLGVEKGDVRVPRQRSTGWSKRPCMRGSRASGSWWRRSRRPSRRSRFSSEADPYVVRAGSRWGVLRTSNRER